MIDTYVIYFIGSTPRQRRQWAFKIPVKTVEKGANARHFSARPDSQSDKAWCKCTRICSQENLVHPFGFGIAFGCIFLLYFVDYFVSILLNLCKKVHSIQYCRRPETSQTSLTLRRWLLLIKRKKSRTV